MIVLIRTGECSNSRGFPFSTKQYKATTQGFEHWGFEGENEGSEVISLIKAMQPNQLRLNLPAQNASFIWQINILQAKKPAVFLSFNQHPLHFVPKSPNSPKASGIRQPPGLPRRNRWSRPGVVGPRRRLRAAHCAHLSAGAAGEELRGDPVPGLRMLATELGKRRA